MRRPALIILLCVPMTACGGGKTKPATAPSSTKAKTQATTTSANPLAAARRRLEAKGFALQAESTSRSPRTDSGGANAQAVLEMTKGKLTLTVVRFSSAASATRAARVYGPLRHANPEQVALVTKGPTLYVGVVREPAKVPRKVFEAAVATAEAR